MRKEIFLDGHNLQTSQVCELAHNPKVKVSIHPDSLEKMSKSRKYVLNKVKSDHTYYGINTGFGALSSKKIEKDKLEKLQLNLIRSHCTGVGPPFLREVVRAIMLLRANCLCSGYSGINPDIVQMILNFINLDLYPYIPSQGSVGASGDLAPLSHLALCLIGEGFFLSLKNEKIPAQEVFKEHHLTPVTLGPKDGLALINGTAVMAALGAVAVERARYLSKISDIVCALTNEALKGTNKAYDPRIHHLKSHPGQVQSAKNLRLLMNNSPLLKSHENCQKVQDPYSLRCAPQVHGAARQTIEHTHEVVTKEINSVTDNPLIFVEEDTIISGGNFHGQAIAFVLDYLAMGVNELGSISERRIEKLMNPIFSDLPAFLTQDSGLNSGLMIAQVTAAALASENKVYCHPASIDSIPTSTDKEDHVSMGVTAGIKLFKVLENVEYILAIELLCSFQGIYLNRPLKTSPPLELVYELLEKYIRPITDDRNYSEDIASIKNILEKRMIVDVVENYLGETL